MTATIYITVEDGIVQKVYSDSPNSLKDVEVKVIDYDVEDYIEEKEKIEEKKGNNSAKRAIVSEHDIHPATIKIDYIET